MENGINSLKTHFFSVLGLLIYTEMGQLYKGKSTFFLKLYKLNCPQLSTGCLIRRSFEKLGIFPLNKKQ